MFGDLIHDLNLIKTLEWHQWPLALMFSSLNPRFGLFKLPE